MKIAIVQTDPEFGNPDANREEVLTLMNREQADLYVLPELFNTGYNFVDADEARALAEPAEGRTFEILQGYAKGKRCHIAYGFAERGDSLFNSAALVGPDGLVGLYRKVHLFYRENLFFAPGDLGFPVFDLPFGKVGMMICFDWVYPESARSLVLQGAEIILHPSNLVMPHCPDAMVTRCLENRVFAATANRIGREERGGNDFTFIGKSEVVSPRGEILVRLSENEASIAVAEIDPALARDKQLNDINNLLAGRRPEAYRLG